MEFLSKKSERLDKFLAAHLKQYSRSQLQRFIKAGAIKVNAHFVIKPGLELRPKDRIVVLEEKLPSREKAFVAEPEPNIPLDVVYEDDDIAVINKPAGLLTHPTLGQPRHTLVNALAARYPEIVKVGESPLRPGIVHRLDKDTSGLLVVAKNQNAFLKMKEQFLERKVVKKYLALVEGVPKNKEGVIEYAIRPSKKFRLKKVAIRVNPRVDQRESATARKSVRAAQTEYKVRKEFDSKYALLEARPITGRTHQIRVHLAAIGHPILGDRLYGSKTRTYADLTRTNAEKKESARETAPSPRESVKFRQFLHAYYLKFTAPNGTPLALETSLPEDLQKVITEIQK